MQDDCKVSYHNTGKSAIEPYFTGQTKDPKVSMEDLS